MNCGRLPASPGGGTAKDATNPRELEGLRRKLPLQQAIMDDRDVVDRLKQPHESYKSKKG